MAMKHGWEKKENKIAFMRAKMQMIMKCLGEEMYGA